MVEVLRNPTRAVRIGSITIGAGNPIAAQSMTATHTQDVAATLEQANALQGAGAGVVRIAVDSKKDAAALPAIRAGTAANLAIDLQENYRLALDVALRLHMAGNDDAVDDIYEHINALDAAVATLSGLAKSAEETEP